MAGSIDSALALHSRKITKKADELLEGTATSFVNTFLYDSADLG
jgi:hypothetical protein